MQKNTEGLRPCGHRLMPSDFATITKAARSWKCTEAEALRRIIRTHIN